MTYDRICKRCSDLTSLPEGCVARPYNDRGWTTFERRCAERLRSGAWGCLARTELYARRLHPCRW